MSDIVERLENMWVEQEPKLLWTDMEAITDEAAKEITRLRAENEKLREALEPFADKEYAYEGWADIARAEVWLNVRDIRAAAAAIREGGNDE